MLDGRRTQWFNCFQAFLNYVKFDGFFPLFRKAHLIKNLHGHYYVKVKKLLIARICEESLMSGNTIFFVRILTYLSHNFKNIKTLLSINSIMKTKSIKMIEFVVPRTRGEIHQ